MNVNIFRTAELASQAAADFLARSLLAPGTRNLVVAGGNSPLELYRRIAQKALPLSRLSVFVLDEYVGVPEDEPRNCANLLRRSVAEAWGIPPSQFHAISSHESRALQSAEAHEKKILAAGGIDAIVLGLGPNGHLGFNEPGSSPLSTARLLNLELTSVEANRRWFRGDHAPSLGVTLGLKTILAAGKIILLAFGPAKRAAVKNMVEGPKSVRSPASWLEESSSVEVFLDHAAAAALSPGRGARFR